MTEAELIDERGMRLVATDFDTELNSLGTNRKFCTIGTKMTDAQLTPQR